MPLKTKELAALERALDKDYGNLLEEVRAEFEAGGNQKGAELVNREPTDAGDVSVADQLASLSLAEIDRHIRELRDIDATRLRIADGSYGTCVDCGQEIGFERLQAYPTAHRCVPCQQHHERTYAGAETPTL